MSGIATGTALMIGGGLAAAGSIGGAALASNAAGNAASTQANAANHAADIQGQLGQEQLGYENYQYQQGRANMQPWLQGGANSLASLQYLLGLQNSATGAGGTSQGQTLSIPGVNGSVSIPGVQGLSASPNTALGGFGSLMQGYQGGPFVAPTAEEAAKDPGYQFTLDQGTKALQAGAAANGSLLTGGTLNAENAFGQGLASNQYNNVYNRALQTYGTNYNTWANERAAKYNQLAALAGLGQTSAQQLNTLGAETSGQVANTLGNTGRAIGQDYQNAAAATASGYVGSANAWGGALNGLGGNAMQMILLNQLMGQQGGGLTVNPNTGIIQNPGYSTGYSG